MLLSILIRLRWFALIGTTLFSALPNARAASDYAVVVSAQSASDAGWRAVVDTLVRKHHGKIIQFSQSVEEARPALRRLRPRYACFVAQPTEATGPFVAAIHRLTRQLDDDPYPDCFWGILTGHDATNALAIARQSAPLTIHKVAGGTALAMDMIEEGVTYDELLKNKATRKSRGGAAEPVAGPDDTTAALVNVLNDGRPDLFVASGHASEQSWQIGYTYANGYFHQQHGQLFGEDTHHQKFPIHSPNPKIFMPVGNCLTGHITGPDCMATAWMNSAGVCQMLGYTVTSWYGYAGWGVLDYFVEQPGRYTFSEAFFANQIALLHRLQTYFPDLMDKTWDDALPVPMTESAQAAGLTADDARGLVYDRDVVAFYGDPAWEARMADRPRFFEQSLTEHHGTFTFDIKPNRGADSFQPVNANGSQRGGRPFIEFFPQRLAQVRILEGMELKPVITDKFILVPNPGTCDPSRNYRVVFQGSRRHE